NETYSIDSKVITGTDGKLSGGLIQAEVLANKKIIPK
ncbi:MAG: hypothetical protein ACI9ZX_001254, partial [Algoriphagus sp.]